MANFIEHLSWVKPLVDARIVELVDVALDDHEITTLLSKGKRLRAGVLTFTYENLCIGKTTDVLDLAVAIELAHAASLILDDMLDEDETRRGIAAHHITKGQKRAMLDTVGILSMPYELASIWGKGYVQALAKTQQGMVKGVITEMLKDPALPASKLYDAIITQKTGKLFSLAALWGYWSTFRDVVPPPKPPNNNCDNIKRWGLHVGKAMQAADDIADLKAVMHGKKAGHLGSEALLLRCLTADQLARDLVADVKKGQLNIGRARDLWNSEGVQKALHVKLNQEIDEANVCISHLWDNGMLDKANFYPVARVISDIMLKEE